MDGMLGGPCFYPLTLAYDKAFVLHLPPPVMERYIKRADMKIIRVNDQMAKKKVAESCKFATSMQMLQSLEQCTSATMIHIPFETRLLYAVKLASVLHSTSVAQSGKAKLSKVFVIKKENTV